VLSFQCNIRFVIDEWRFHKCPALGLAFVSGNVKMDGHIQQDSHRQAHPLKTLQAHGGTWLYQINVTRDCNLRCTHCYIHSEAKRLSQFISAEQFLKVIRDIAEHMEINQYERAEIHVVGGEPTMMGAAFFADVIPKAREILNASTHAHDYGYELLIITNLLTDEALEIAGYFDRVTTSYEPITRFPKPKLEQKWLDNVHLLKSNGVICGVTTSITLPVVQYGAAKLLDKYMDMDIRNVHFGFFIPSGDGLDNIKDVFPEFAQTSDFLIEAANWYFEHRDQYPDLYVNPVESMLTAIHEDQPMDDIVCPIITGSVDVNWDGNAMTCIEAGGEVNPNWVGNVFQSTIAEVAASQKFLREVLQASKPHKVCRTCDEYRYCKSGCGVLFKYWSAEENNDCPGFRKFIRYIKTLHGEGLRPKGARLPAFKC
jgi:radical SAM protein with 4Fe4S-binding SPASM domain